MEIKWLPFFKCYISSKNANTGWIHLLICYNVRHFLSSSKLNIWGFWTVDGKGIGIYHVLTQWESSIHCIFRKHMQMDKGSKCKLSRKHTQHNQTDKHTANCHITKLINTLQILMAQSSLCTFCQIVWIGGLITSKRLSELNSLMSSQC